MFVEVVQVDGIKEPIIQSDLDRTSIAFEVYDSQYEDLPIAVNKGFIKTSKISPQEIVINARVSYAFHIEGFIYVDLMCSDVKDINSWIHIGEQVGDIRVTVEYNKFIPARHYDAFSTQQEEDGNVTFGSLIKYPHLGNFSKVSEVTLYLSEY